MPNNSTFNLRDLKDQIRTHGEVVNYFRGMKCPCGILQNGSNVPDANRARLDCVACHGLGWVWIPSGNIVGLVTNIQQEKELLMAGIVSMGDLVFSPQLNTTLSDYDKIQLSWSEGIPYEGELLIRGSGSVDSTMYGIMDVPPDGCISVNATTGDITQYEPNVDFTYSDNVITWGLTGNAPPSGSVYSFKYSALVDWIVFAPPQPRRERGTNLGQRVVLKKKHSIFNGV